MTEKCSLATELHCTVLKITTSVYIVAIDNVCMHYFPFTFSECPIENDIFGIHNF